VFNKKLAISFLVLLSLISTSCGNSTLRTKKSTPTKFDSTESLALTEGESVDDTIYPAPGTVASSDNRLNEQYPAPAASPLAQGTVMHSPLSIPKPKDDAGVVVGKLITSDDANNLPYLSTIYLARTVNPKQQGYPPLVAFSEETDPKAIQDDSGQFLFTDVPPGAYALIIWTPISSNVVQNPETKENLIFEVKAGELTDLGVVPIP
jgi:hypothetical protein